MDKLASLVSKLDMKLDKKETQYRPKIYQGRNGGHADKDRTVIGPGIDLTVGTVVSTTIGEEEIIIITIIIGIIDPTIEIEIGQGMAMEIGEMTGKISRRDNYRQDNGSQRYRHRSASKDHSRYIQAKI